MESIKKLLDYLKEYDVESIINYGARRPHGSLGKLIEDVELSLKNSEYSIQEIDFIE